MPSTDFRPGAFAQAENLANMIRASPGGTPADDWAVEGVIAKFKNRSRESIREIVRALEAVRGFTFADMYFSPEQRDRILAAVRRHA